MKLKGMDRLKNLNLPGLSVPVNFQEHFTHMTRRKAAAALLLFTLLSPHVTALRAQTQAAPQPTPDAIERIKDEGLQRSEVMKTLEYLTDVIGPRLTGSPALRRANEWTRDRLTA